MSNDKIIKPKIELIEAEPEFLNGPGGDFGFRKNQEITDDLLRDLADARHNSQHAREGNFMEIAAIPTIIVEKWLREGFDIFDKNVKARDIVARLKREDLTAFLSTNKSV